MTEHIKIACEGALFSDGKAPEPLKKDGDGGDEGSCAAFGYLRGIRDSSTSVEFRFLSGNSMWFPYSWLGPWRYDPSEGLLLKFSGDVVYLVLIKGSNLDKPLSDSSINLTNAGLQRSRVLWIREMTERRDRACRRHCAYDRQYPDRRIYRPGNAQEWLKSRCSSIPRRSKLRR